MATMDKMLLVGIFGAVLLLIVLVVGDASVSGLSIKEIVPGTHAPIDKSTDILAKRGILSFTLGILVLTVIIVIVTYFVHRKVE